MPSWFAGVVLIIANDERFAASNHAKAGAEYPLRFVEEQQNAAIVAFRHK